MPTGLPEDGDPVEFPLFAASASADAFAQHLGERKVAILAQTMKKTDTLSGEKNLSSSAHMFTINEKFDLRWPKNEYATSMSGSGTATSSYGSSFWEIRCGWQDGSGDSTVPASSGAAPRASGGAHTRQQFRLTGFSHEPAYQDAVAQKVTHYAITKLAALARME